MKPLRWFLLFAFLIACDAPPQEASAPPAHTEEDASMEVESPSTSARQGTSPRPRVRPERAPLPNRPLRLLRPEDASTPAEVLEVKPSHQAAALVRTPQAPPASSVFAYSISLSLEQAASFIDGQTRDALLETTLKVEGQPMDLVVTRRRSVSVTREDEARLALTLPVSVKLSGQLSICPKGVRLGKLCKETAVVLMHQGVITLRSGAALDEAWHLQLVEPVHEVQLLGAPVLKVGVLKVPMSDAFNQKLEEVASAQLHEVLKNGLGALHITRRIKKAWSLLQRSWPLGETGRYLRVIPSGLFTTPLWVSEEALGFELALEGQAKVEAERSKARVALPPNPGAEGASLPASRFALQLPICMELDEASAMISEALGQERLEVEGTPLRFSSAHLEPSGAGLSLKVDFVFGEAPKQAEGALYFYGVPVGKDGVITFEALDYEVETEDLLTKIGFTIFLENALPEKVAELVQIEQEERAEAMAALRALVEDKALSNDIRLRAEIAEGGVDQVLVEGTSLCVHVAINGDARLQLEQ